MIHTIDLVEEKEKENCKSMKGYNCDPTQGEEALLKMKVTKKTIVPG